jgi:hypothetical protein
MSTGSESATGTQLTTDELKHVVCECRTCITFISYTFQVDLIRVELTLMRCCYCGQAEDFDIWGLELTDHVSRVKSTTIWLVDVGGKEALLVPL